MTCHHLSVNPIAGFYCNLDAGIWGDFPRSLDWASWSPDLPYVEIPGVTLSFEVIQLVVAQNVTLAVAELRKLNPDLILSLALAACEEIRVKIRSSSQDSGGA